VGAGEKELTVELATSLAAVEAKAWDALAPADNPFLDHAFLRLLETSQSVGEAAGWIPVHVLVKEGEKLVGACPTYLKTHSYGEYIFDWSWANAAERSGIPYYPKLVVGVPFTPATGPRFLVHAEADDLRIRSALLKGLEVAQGELGAQGIHILFCTDEEAAFCEKAGLARRATHQFHWRNDGYKTFEDFLGRLTSRARKQIRKERRRLHESPLILQRHRGDEISDAEWEAMYRLYMSTSARKWGEPYLTADFFMDARQKIGHLALLSFARVEDRVLAGTLSFQKGRHLYGRYWGAFELLDGLHFELCYYQLIDHAIEKGMTLVEAGAQGEHKIKRGFVPVAVHSAHRLAHPRVQEIIAQSCRHERNDLLRSLPHLQRHAPFKDGAAPNLPFVAGLDKI
jgi:predicted N-acyltransferase